MAPRSRLRLEIATLAATLWLPATAGAEPTSPERDQLQARYAEGQDRYDLGEYAAAAETWADLLAAIPEREEDRLTRQTLVLMVVTARIDAYRQDPDPEAAIEHLRVAKRVVDEYWSTHRSVYGEDVSDPAVAERFDELEQLLARAAERQEITDDGGGDDGMWVCLQPCLDPLPPPLVVQRGCGKDDRDGSDGTMLGALGLPLLLRRRRRRDVLEAVASRLPADVVARLRDRDDDEDPRA